MRHARKMLEEMKLRDLGQFAAHMGFQLVPFFKKEQGRAAKTEEPVRALKAIHRDFEWPYARVYHYSSIQSIHYYIIMCLIDPSSFSMHSLFTIIYL